MSLPLTSAVRAVCLLALVGPRPFCRPPIPPGPSAVDQAAAPAGITIRDEPAGHAEFWVRAGYALDPPGFEGLAFATAHALVAEGAEVAVHTDAEWVRFQVNCADIECITAAARTLTQGPTEPGVARARSHAEAELSADPSTSTLAAVWLFEGHPYGHLAAGRAGSLSTLTRSKLTDFHRRHYVRSTVRAIVDSQELADAMAPHLQPLPITLPGDFPLQRPEPVQNTRALLVDAPSASATATVAIPSTAVAQVSQSLPALDGPVTVELIGGPRAEFPRRQAHLDITAHGKTAHYAARHLQHALRDLRCEPALAPWLEAPSVVIAGPDPESTSAGLDEEVPRSHVYCTDDAEPAVPILDLSSAVLVSREDLFR